MPILRYIHPLQAPAPKQSVLRVDVTGVLVSDSFPDRKHCLELVFKSGSDKWYLSAASEVRLLLLTLGAAAAGHVNTLSVTL